MSFSISSKFPQLLSSRTEFQNHAPLAPKPGLRASTPCPLTAGILYFVNVKCLRDDSYAKFWMCMYMWGEGRAYICPSDSQWAGKNRGPREIVSLDLGQLSPTLG